MQISVSEFVVKLSEEEMWLLMFTLNENLTSHERLLDFSKNTTIPQSARERLEIYEKFAMRLGRPDMYAHCLAKINAALKKS